MKRGGAIVQSTVKIAMFMEDMMTKSEQQMWDAIKSHYERYPEKWSVCQEGKDTFYFDSTGVRVAVYYTSSGYTAY